MNLFIGDAMNYRVRAVGHNPTPAIFWPTPAAIAYGTPLSTTQLDATANVAGTFSYSPALGAILHPGSYTLSVTFTPTDTTDYSSTISTVGLTVNQATPPIVWSTPANIPTGTALSGSQLNASSTVPGTFNYTPAAGTVVTVGLYTLSAAFTPADTVDYTSSTATATLIVTPSSGSTFDNGLVKLIVNGSTVSQINLTSTSTPSSVAEALAAAASTSPVYVSAVDNSVYLTAANPGAGSDFSYSLSFPTSAPFTQPSFSASPASGTLQGGGNGQTGSSPTTVYSYSGVVYDGVSNLTSYTDSYADPLTGAVDPIMGTWSFTYDTLNRLTMASANQPGNPDTNYCWGYDAFGNRTIQIGSPSAFAVGSPVAPGSQPCQPASGAAFTSVWSNQSPANNNRLAATSAAPGGVSYDASGDVTYDGKNQYLYDGAGRICAVYSIPMPNVSTMIGYLYDAGGTRVAKGTITAWSCDPGVNGFQTTNDYILGPGGEQVTEMGVDTTAGSNGTPLAPQHTNVYAAGTLLGTYDNDGLHFYFNDPLGTRRAQTDYAGVIEQTCASLPYGDLLNCTTPPNSGGSAYPASLIAPTEQHFTGKERDTESGNDYFGARYYSSAMGRFMSPDWSAKAEPVPYAKLDNPQSLNLYAYVLNNPVGNRDPDGHWCLFGHGTTCTPPPPPPPTPAPPKPPTPQQVKGAAPTTIAPGPKYATADQAGKTAVNNINPTSIKQDKEYAGRVYQNADGSYGTTSPNKGDQASSRPGEVPDGTANAGMYHTHGGPDPQYDNEHFSDIHNADGTRSGDIPFAQSEGVPSYLGTPSGQVLKYDPSTDSVTQLQPPTPQ
ncbi:MAG: DUF4329 domain-containing protein [Terracidiphilus sp.]